MPKSNGTPAIVPCRSPVTIAAGSQVPEVVLLGEKTAVGPAVSGDAVIRVVAPMAEGPAATLQPEHGIVVGLTHPGDTERILEGHKCPSTCDQQPPAAFDISN